MTNRDLLLDLGYEDSIIFENPDYDDAIVGVTTDGQIVYDYSQMVVHLMHADNMSEEEAAEFIDYNSIRSLPYAGNGAPIVMYKLN